jgi:hypothetical protein
MFIEFFEVNSWKFDFLVLLCPNVYTIVYIRKLELK